MKKAEKTAVILLIAFLHENAMTQTNVNYSLTNQSQKRGSLIKMASQCVHSRLVILRDNASSINASLIYGIIGIYGFTNITIYIPVENQVVNAHLFGRDGGEIPKTAYGQANGRPLKPDPKFLDGSWQNEIPAMYGHSRIISFLEGYGSASQWRMNILKSFCIKDPGEYRLQVEVRLFTKDIKGVFQPFILPPVETKVIISEKDLIK